MKSNELVKVSLVTLTIRHLLLLLGSMECRTKAVILDYKCKRERTFLHWLHCCLKLAGPTLPCASASRFSYTATFQCMHG